MKYIKLLTVSLCLFAILIQCKKDDTNPDEQPTPYDLVIPTGFPDMEIPEDNSFTVEGIALGRRLFYDPILSGDNTQSCSSCHAQAFAFSDNGLQFSVGIDGLAGNRNAPTIINPGWTTSMFWDGREPTLEAQAGGPVPNPIEMHLEWVDAEAKLNAHEEYPALFKKAFQTDVISQEHVVKAIAQFERTFLSFNSRYDKALRNEIFLTEEEENGFEIYFTEKGDCFHCHGTVLLTDNLFHNNGMDSIFTDKGLMEISGNPTEEGKFKTPTLRNIEFSAPYMHDGRFATLEEVIDFYSDELKFSSTIDPLMKNVHQGGLKLNAQEKQDLLAFLKTFTDTSFLNNPDLTDPL